LGGGGGRSAPHVVAHWQFATSDAASPARACGFRRGWFRPGLKAFLNRLHLSSDKPKRAGCTPPQAEEGLGRVAISPGRLRRNPRMWAAGRRLAVSGGGEQRRLADQEAGPDQPTAALTRTDVVAGSALFSASRRPVAWHAVSDGRTIESSPGRRLGAHPDRRAKRDGWRGGGATRLCLLRGGLRKSSD